MPSIAEPSLQVPTPTYSLFNDNAVGLATILGTPVAGSALMALNYRRMGQTRKAAEVLVVGIAVTGLLILLGWNLPHSVTSPIALLALFVTARSARSLQGKKVMEHIQQGGRLGSKWMAFGLGAGICAVIFLSVFIATYTADHQPGVLIGTKDEVYYSGTATREDAQSLGNALKAHGYFNDEGASGKGADVFLAKGKDGTTISFITKEGSWEQPDIVSLFEEIGREVAPSVGGFPIQVRLLNIQHDVKKQSTVGRAAFAGNDVVYYLGVATASEAQTLGKALTSNGFFTGKGADVFLSKHNDGTTLSFVVGDGTWDNPAFIADFERIARQAATAAGSLPIRLRLVNTSLQVKKDEVIH
jgi:hypothetical protein